MNHRGLLVILGLTLAAVAGAAEPAGQALIGATKRGDLARVETLLAGGTNPDAHDAVNNTALIFAARDGRLEIARALIAHGATVNWVDGEGVTPLILAAFKNHIEIVEMLLGRGADPGIRDQWGRRALDHALRRGEDDAIAVRLRAAR